MKTKIILLSILVVSSIVLCFVVGKTQEKLTDIYGNVYTSSDVENCKKSDQVYICFNS